MKVLVAYATKHGSTGEVAEAVATGLGKDGFDVDLLPARAIRGLAGYDAVVIGAALYMGRVHADARRLLSRLRDEPAGPNAPAHLRGSSVPESWPAPRPSGRRFGMPRAGRISEERRTP